MRSYWAGDPSRPAQFIHHECNRLFKRLVLPDPNDPPAFLVEREIRSAVTLSVTADLILPVICIRRRQSTVKWATMPKTSVNEYSESLAWESEIDSK